MRHHKKIKYKKSKQPGPNRKCRRAKYCNTSGRPNRYTVGWMEDKNGTLVYTGVDEKGNTTPLPEPEEDKGAKDGS